MIRRRGQQADESSSDEEDVFTALSRSTKRSKVEGPPPGLVDRFSHTQPEESEPKMVLPKPVTSSMKRHHKPNDDRKAKMDALLQELEAEKQKVSTEPSRFIPEKKGSFVDPSEEHLTTNIFVGNLAPSITEEELRELFLQFGELYSVKIMWPRTPEERHRNRHTGFVCFMNRADAEEAMEVCNESDPFNVGRFLMMRWGKNVKRNQEGSAEDDSRGPGQNVSKFPVDAPHSRQGSDHYSDEISLHSDDQSPSVIEFRHPPGLGDLSEPTKYDRRLHSEDAIRVRLPADQKRYHFISTVASSVAKNGSQFERKLLQKEANNDEFGFLQYVPSSDVGRDEHIFYRWRVYSFCQGDTYSIWRTEPFQMFQAVGRFWIPPPLDNEVSDMERHPKPIDTRREKDCFVRSVNSRQEPMTGRQIELARRNRRKGNNKRGETGTKLSTADRERFNLLVRTKLTRSRESICSAMAFCFEKSAAAHEISALLKDTLMDDSPNVTMEMRIARLYLLSDILFNSQQPGVRNAFFYRDAVEKMAPEIFTSLGRHGAGQIGRMTMNKLRTVVSAVLGAWTEWSVYNPAFLDELDARFSGKIPEANADDASNTKDYVQHDVESSTANLSMESTSEVVIIKARGEWTTVGEDSTIAKNTSMNSVRVMADRDLHDPGNEYLDGSPLDDFSTPNSDKSTQDVDGQTLDDSDIDGSPLCSEKGDLDGSSIDENLDGTALEGDELTPFR